MTDYTFQDEDGTLMFANIENGDIEKDGTLFYIKFKIKETDKKTTNINLVLTGQDAANSKLETIPFDAVNSTVKIR